MKTKVKKVICVSDRQDNENLTFENIVAKQNGLDKKNFFDFLKIHIIIINSTKLN